MKKGNNCNIIIVFLLTAVVLFTLSACEDQPNHQKSEEYGWQQDELGWRLTLDGENYISDSWEEYDNNWYYFNEGGYLVTGWLQQGENWYYLYEDGAMATGIITVEGKREDFGKDGIWQGTEQSDTLWIKTKDGWQMEYSDGTFPSEEWAYFNKSWYYFDQDGFKQTGWITIDENRYYLNGQGEMQTGWLQEEGKWYYLNTDGTMQTTEAEIDGVLYQFDSNGVML